MFEMSSQSLAALSIAPTGEITAVWSSRRQQGGTYGVYAQRFDAEGRPLGAETRVNLWTDSHQWVPAVVGGSDGASWIAWQSHGQDGAAGSIVARRFAAGQGGSEVLVNDAWRGHQADPILARSSDGEVLAVWTSLEGPRERLHLRARRLDAAGRPVGDEFEICDEAAWHQRTPAATYLPGGGFVIAYAVGDEDPGTSGIHLQRFDRGGEPVGAPIVASGSPRWSQIEPAVAASPDGSLIVAWLDAESDGDDYGVLARVYRADGTPADAPFVVNESERGAQHAAAIAVAADGSFVIAYNGRDADGTGVLARAFDAAGGARGGEFRINGHTDGEQAMRPAAGTQRLAFAPDGALLCAWSGDGGLGDGSAVHVTRISPAPPTVAVAEQGARPGVGPGMPAALSAAADGAAEPHVPPTFDVEAIDDADREIRVGAAGETGFTAVVNTGWTPPDPHMGVGPDHIVVMTNGNISFYTKDGTRTFSQDIVGGGGFWGAQGASGFVFDPEVVYDEISGRFFVMAADRNSGNGRSYALVGVSDDSDPNGTWHKYRFDTTALAGPTFDSPNIGVDADVVYITGDGFGGPQPYPMYTFDKASLLAGDPPAVSRSFWLNTSTQSAGIAPVSYDDPPALYLIEHREGANNTSVRLIALQDPLGTPTFTETSLAVPVYGNRPESPPQAGTSSRPNTFDARFWSVAYRNGSLWAAHHINQSRVVARWYEIAMNGWPDSGDTPELVQSGEIDPGPTVRTFFNAITVDDQGNAAMTYARSAPDEFISMETAFRLAGDPLGTMRPGVQRQINTGPYTAGRWGDYAAVNVDPAGGTFWAHHEYAAGGSWRTWVQSFDLPCGVADVNCDGVVDFDDLLRVLSAWGPCKDCPEDVDGDGEVEFDDVLLVLSNWS